VPPERIHRSQIDRLLAFGGLQDQASHRFRETTHTRASGQSFARELPVVEVEGPTFSQVDRSYNVEILPPCRTALARDTPGAARREALSRRNKASTALPA
jgi:hypothetical protein